MIPKKIHYCWFGRNDLPNLTKKCIISWQRLMPECEIILWNEDNFDLEINEFVKQAYKLKKYAFVSDFCRLYALKNHGGIYMDTDVEVIKPLPDFLFNLNAFSGFEDNKHVPTGIMASEKDGRWVNDLIDYYWEKPFINKDGSLNTTTNVQIITHIMKSKGLVLNNTTQHLPNYVSMYSNDYFSPKNYKTGLIKKTNNTLTIHHFAGSWLDNKIQRKNKYTHILHKIFGETIIKKTLKLLGSKSSLIRDYN